ncbi:MAG: LysR family transcriptional regulator [Burkholderiales bacterium]|nr:LysR family transcriptional regulator [Burkholderiales bacterium]
MDPKFQQLRAFYYAYRMRSLTKAGEQLHLSQSAMSRLIKQLEEVLGQRLFDRTSGALCTTEAAEEAIHVVERILTNVEYLKTSLKGLADKRRGMVRFAITPTLAAQIMPDVLARFRANWTNVEVDMLDATPERVVQLVLDEAAQFGIVTAGEPRSDLDYRLLVEDYLCVICREDSPLSGLSRVTWRDLAGTSVIATVGGSNWPDVVRQIIEEQNLPAAPRHTAAFSFTALGMAARGLGVAILPSLLALGSPKDFGLVARKLHDPVVPRGLHVLTKARRSLSPAGLALLDLVQQVVSADTRPPLR